MKNQLKSLGFGVLIAIAAIAFLSLGIASQVYQYNVCGSNVFAGGGPATDPGHPVCQLVDMSR